ncbi:hypothetical protein NW759_015899, partial [Fusarium solani]
MSHQIALNGKVHPEKNRSQLESFFKKHKIASLIDQKKISQDTTFDYLVSAGEDSDAQTKIYQHAIENEFPILNEEWMKQVVEAKEWVQPLPHHFISQGAGSNPTPASMVPDPVVPDPPAPAPVPAPAPPAPAPAPPASMVPAPAPPVPAPPVPAPPAPAPVPAPAPPAPAPPAPAPAPPASMVPAPAPPAPAPAPDSMAAAAAGGTSNNVPAVRFKTEAVDD